MQLISLLFIIIVLYTSCNVIVNLIVPLFERYENQLNLKEYKRFFSEKRYKSLKLLILFIIEQPSYLSILIIKLPFFAVVSFWTGLDTCWDKIWKIAK